MKARVDQSPLLVEKFKAVSLIMNLLLEYRLTCIKKNCRDQ